VLWTRNGLPLNTHISMYARTNRCSNEGGSRTNYVRSSIPSLYYFGSFQCHFFFRAMCLYFRRGILHTRSAARDRSDFFALQGWDINLNFVTLIYTQKSTRLFEDKKYIKEPHTERCHLWS